MNQTHKWLYMLALGIYVGLGIFLPVDPAAVEKYQVSETALKLLSLTIVIPFSIIYLVAFYGFSRFKAYADSIRDTKEGPAFAQLSNGIMVLAFSLPIGGALNSVLNYLARTNVDFMPTATILKNYINLAFAFVVFMLLAKGAEKLLKTLKRSEPQNWAGGWLLFTIILSALFTWLITARSPLEEGRSRYFLPDWLILATIAVPYLYIWLKGIRAAYYIYLYKTRTRGSVYQKSLNYIAQGIAVIVVISILLQVLVTLLAQLNRLDLTPLLLVIYFLLALYMVGYGLVARGARRLKKIEEV